MGPREKRSRKCGSTCLLQVFFGIVAVAVALRFLVPPHVVQPTRWIRSSPRPGNGSYSSDGDPTSPKTPIECPKWNGAPGGKSRIVQPKGKWNVAPRNAGETRVFLFAVVASTPENDNLLRHFVDFYVRRAGIPAANIAITVQASTDSNPRTRTLLKTLDELGVGYYDVWVGTFTSETKAWHREELVDSTLDADDWLVVADIDELHQFPGVVSFAAATDADATQHQGSIAQYLRSIEQKHRANFVTARWEDRVAIGGHLNHVRSLQRGEQTSSLEAQYPLRCSMTEWTRPPGGFLRLVLPAAEDEKVVAHKVFLRVHRSAHYVKTRSYVYAALAKLDPLKLLESSAKMAWPRAPPGEPLASQHYKWVAGLVPYLDQRVHTYEKCGMLWSYESSAIVQQLEAHEGRVCTTCGELACSYAAPARRRRVAIVTTVWDEHVDGVSITINRVARWLHGSSHSEVLVATPHDPAVKKPLVDMSAIPKLELDSFPIFALIGRNDYVVGLNLGKRHKQALTAFDAEIYHLVSPDLLGFSAQNWARETGRCSVCTYHTQLDRYVRFYTEKHSFVDKLKPRLAVQKLFGSFYGGCDVVAVPNAAIGDKLVAKMGIPAEKIGYFPRGVNTTQYRPSRRDDAWRRKEARAGKDEVVVLWAARLVKEKGAVIFAESVAALLSNASFAARRDGGAAAIAKMRIVVVGDGPERDFMLNRLPPEITTFYGHLSGEDLWRAYASSDIYFFPSHTEAFPNTLLEAQASGLAVLAPAYSVNRALVPHDAGLLVDEHAGPAEFAEGLYTLITDTKRRKRIAQAAIKVASARTWDAAFGDLSACYDRCKALGYPKDMTRTKRLR